MFYALLYELHQVLKTASELEEMEWLIFLEKLQ